MPEYRHPAPPNYRTSRRTRPTAVLEQHANTDPKAVVSEANRVTNNTSVPPLVHTNGIGERVLYRDRATQTVNKITPE